MCLYAGTSDGTDPEVSTWYWRTTTAPVAPAPAPTVAPIAVGDKVRFFIGTTVANGIVASISGANATVSGVLVSAPLAGMTKIV